MDSEKFPLWTGDELLRLCREALAISADEPCRLEPIIKGGSVRAFYRLERSAGTPAILMHYSLGKPENLLHSPLTRFLDSRGIRVPGILWEDAGRQLLWVEDIGRIDLLELTKTAEQPTRLAAYSQVLQELARFQAIRHAELGADELPEMMPAFDEATYLWEQQYFMDHCLGDYFQVPAALRAELAALPVLREIAATLGQTRPCLVHRDFQSTNIMLRDAHTPYLIDYQGMRPGQPEYDVASLLYDPYVDLAAAERELLLAAYTEARPAGLPAFERLAYLRCALQRVMQALGAYGNLGLNRGLPKFLEYIPIAIPLLQDIVRELDEPGLEPLATVLAECSVSRPRAATASKPAAAGDLGVAPLIHAEAPAPSLAAPTGSR